MAQKAAGRKLAILATDGFEETELTSPREAIEKAGGRVEVISPKSGEIQGFRHMEKGKAVKVDRKLGEAKADDYDAILIPGGLFNPDALRTEQAALDFAASFAKAGKPVFAICHGPQVLISAGLVKGKRMTSVKAVQKDLENAGAKVEDTSVVVDDGWVTSRTPDDLDAFNGKIVEEICEGRHARATA